MIKIFTNPKGETVVAKIQEAESEYGYSYSFWKLDFKRKNLIPATPAYVTKMLETLSRSHDRTDLWVCMRVNGWVGR